MGKITERFKNLFRRRRAVTPEEGEDLSNWVNEGGAFDPDGPPPVIEPRDDDRNT